MGFVLILAVFLFVAGAVFCQEDGCIFVDCSVVVPDDCSWYVHCLAPRVPACVSVTNVMAPKCAAYVDLEDSLTEWGRRWATEVRRCLMASLARYVHSVDEDGLARTSLGPGSGADDDAGRPPASCDRVEEIFFDEHIECYVSAGSISVCDLPFMDLVRVLVRAVDLLWSPHAYRTLRAALFLKLHCIGIL